MIAVEVFLIIIGVMFIVISFYVTEKLSQQDLEQISLMSEADLKSIAEKQTKDVKAKVETFIEEIIDESLEITKRGLERETNKKIMAVSEYSDTVMENINSSHNEIMFLHSMLNDKQAEVAELVSDLQRMTKQIRDMDLENAVAKAEAVSNNIAKVEKAVESGAMIADEYVEETSVEPEAVSEENDSLASKNEQILLLYKEGKDEVEIAKTLDCGLGEVRLVLGLYNEA